MSSMDRRSFLGAGLAAGFAAGWSALDAKAEDAQAEAPKVKPWEPYSDKKIRVGLVGYGYCKFSAQFSFQHHPNVEIAAVSDLFPDRCAELAKAVKCEKTYPSLEELVKDDTIDAVFCATDAPSHAKHAILCLEHGKHVCHAVPVFYGDPEDGDRLFETVKKNPGLKYAMFETSTFHADLYAMEKIYKAGGFGRIIYSEGEYDHTKEPGQPAYPSYKDWRKNGTPLWYPTHATAYYVGVTHKSFVDVSAQGIMPFTPNPTPNGSGNVFIGEAAFLHTSEGGLSRMMCCNAYGQYLEAGRVRGEIGGFDATYCPVEEGFVGNGDGKRIVAALRDSLARPALPPGVEPGGHGGSHGQLCADFVDAILKDREPRVGICDALNMTVPGYYAHLSATRDGETLKIPQYTL